MKWTFNSNDAILDYFGQYASQLDIDVFTYVNNNCAVGDTSSYTPTFTNSQIKAAIKYKGPTEDIVDSLHHMREEGIMWYKHQETARNKYARGSGRYKARTMLPKTTALQNIKAGE